MLVAFCGVLVAFCSVALLGGCGRDGAGGAAGPRGQYDLEIITPHNDHIQREFERAFVEHVGRPLNIRWIKKGTGQIIQQLDAQERAVKGGSFGLDVFFGGGAPDHELAATKGYLEKPAIPDEILGTIPETIAGVANFDDEGLWYGAALSAFGVLMNLRGLENQGLPRIERWRDLAEPRMYSWVLIADPRKSSSVRVSYELILQQYGWDDGWPLLMQIAANSRDIKDSSSAIPNEIAAGDALAGPCIDFYAYSRVAEAGAGVLAYVNPLGGSAITPDPISMLRKPPHRKLAERFIAFVLSPQGQMLWVLPPGAENGPKEHALYRMPIRPGIGEDFAEKLALEDPYKEAARGTFRKMDDELQRRRNVLVAELMGAALVDLHADCKTAWKALIDAGMPVEAVQVWRAVPFSEAESLEIAGRLEGGGQAAREITRSWTRAFKQRYDRVVELCR